MTQQSTINILPTLQKLYETGQSPIWNKIIQTAEILQDLKSNFGWWISNMKDVPNLNNFILSPSSHMLALYPSLLFSFVRKLKTGANVKRSIQMLSNPMKEVSYV